MCTKLVQIHDRIHRETLDRSRSRVSGTPSMSLSPFHITPAVVW